MERIRVIRCVHPNLCIFLEIINKISCSLMLFSVFLHKKLSPETCKDMQ